MRSLYQEQILEQYKNPHNEGELDEPDVEGRATNPSCGDDLTFQAVIEDGTITDVRFHGDGCALSVAAASLLTEELQGADVTAVKKLASEDLFALLNLDEEAISPMRVKCVLLPRDAAQEMMRDE